MRKPVTLACSFQYQPDTKQIYNTVKKVCILSQPDFCYYNVTDYIFNLYNAKTILRERVEGIGLLVNIYQHHNV